MSSSAIAATHHWVNQRRSYDGNLCTVRYVGKVEGTTGEWLGVEWDDPTRGKHSGQHQGVKYFTCTVTLCHDILNATSILPMLEF